MYFRLRLLFFGIVAFSIVRAQEGGVLEDEENTISAKEDYHPPAFKRPTINKNDVYFVDWFEDLKGIGKHWIKSIAKKDGVEETLAKYNGEWKIGAPSKVAIENDYGLIVKHKARHHAIAAKLRKPFEFNGKPLVVHYEVKYEEGQECGGGYIKLISADSSLNINVFNDKTPYSIMFGPDKCGTTSKVHFIIRIKNPKNGSYSEHHARQPAKSPSSYFDDKATHLYTLVVTADNTFNVMVDQVSILSGNMLTDLEPSVIPPKEIPDPEDKKPDDWDNREYIVDANAKKPEDWSEDEPLEIVDEDATMPSDWLEEEKLLIPDPNAKKQDDWDDEVDGEWEPRKINNPLCEGRSGCGKWNKPMKPNPAYKGKWTAPKIANPAYKGQWSARLIENPHYFEAEPYKQLDPIAAIGFELWTMSSNIIIDNILITDSTDIADEFARQTFVVKSIQEKLLHTITNPTKNIFEQVMELTEEKPWLWAVFVLVLLIPIILISVYCFGKKSPSAASHPKKTDEVQMDDPLEPEEDEEEVQQREESPPGRSSVQPQEKSDNSVDTDNSDESEKKSSAEESGLVNEKPPASPAAPTRRARVRRE